VCIKISFLKQQIFTLKTLISTGSLIKFSYRSPLMEFPQHFFLSFLYFALLFFAQSVKSIISFLPIHFFFSIFFIGGNWKKIFLLFFVWFLAGFSLLLLPSALLFFIYSSFSHPLSEFFLGHAALNATARPLSKVFFRQEFVCLCR